MKNTLGGKNTSGNKKIDGGEIGNTLINTIKGKIHQLFSGNKKGIIVEEPLNINKEIEEALDLNNVLVHNLMEASTKKGYLDIYKYVNPNEVKNSEVKNSHVDVIFNHEMKRGEYFTKLRAALEKYTPDQDFYTRINNKYTAIKKGTKDIHTKKSETLIAFYEYVINLCMEANKIIQDTKNYISYDSFAHIPTYINGLVEYQSRLEHIDK